MTTSALQSQLDRLQADTLAALDRARTLLDGEPEDARSELAKVRWQLARKLREYQIVKHSRIFDPAVASGSSSLAAAGKNLKADCIAGGERFDRYLREWSGEDVVQRWSDFRPATLCVGRVLRDHLVAEAVQIRLLLSQVAKLEMR